jgi:hypothetical protein
MAQKAVLDAQTKKVQAPEMWSRLASWLNKTVELANKYLGSGSGIIYRREANEITISSSVGGTKSVTVKFNPDSGRISYGHTGTELNRFEPVINGVGFAYRTETTDITKEEEMGKEILSYLR